MESIAKHCVRGDNPWVGFYIELKQEISNILEQEEV
jgi:hypothetical protein